MDKQKQIEEMHQILLSAGYDWWKTYPNGKTKSEYEAECFYNAGYRKIPEGSVLVSKQVWEEHIENFDKCREAIEERVRKETAEKFAERLKTHLEQSFTEMYCSEIRKSHVPINLYVLYENIDEICKEFTGGDE